MATRPERFARLLRAALVLVLAALVAAPALGAGKRGRAMPIPRPEPDAEEMRPMTKDRPDQAEAFFLKQRLAPGMKALPVERLLAGNEHARRMRLHSASAGAFLDVPLDAAQVSALSWTALGPGNIGGRTRAFQFSPADATGNTIYVGGVAGGVWKTTNGGTSWTPLGDFMANLAVSSLAIDPVNPQIIYAGTGEGYFNIDSVRGAGIFKSTDGGANWSQLAATAPPGSTNFTRVNALAISPNDHTVVYAATRVGLLRSTDSGSTWTLQIDASAALGCMSVVVRSDVATNDTVVASCGTFSPTATATGIWRSTNGNAASPTWTHVLGPSGSGATQSLANMGRTSLAIAKSNQATMYALIACAQNVGTDCGSGDFADGLLAVWRSTDGGASWSARYTNTFSTTTFANALLTNPYVLICNNTPGFNQGWYDNVIAVDPTNADRVFVGGIDQWRSDDGGASWGAISYWWLEGYFPYAHADQHGIAFHPNYNGTTETRTYITNDGGIFVASDAATAAPVAAKINFCPANTGHLRGATWTGLNNGYGVTQYYHGTVYPGGAKYFGGTQDNGTSRGTDAAGPNAWAEILGGDGGWTAINKNTSGATTVIYAENTGVSIQRSDNDGGAFASKTSGIGNTGCGQFINPFQMDPNNPLRLFTSHNVLWRTANSGDSWTQASAAITGTSCTTTPDSGERFSNYAVAPGNSDLLVAGTDTGRVCRLTNATTSTSATALADCSFPAGGGYVSAIAFDPQNNARVYATISTFGLGHVWRSTNSGVTWGNIDGSGGSGLPDVPATSVAVSPFDSNTIYVGTDIGVFVTTDGGTSWARENTGFANVITDHLVFSPIDATSAHLFAFTHGRGAFRTIVTSAPKSPSTTTLVSSPDPSVFGQSVALTATVSGSAGTATGTVQFKDGGSNLGSPVALASGSAVLNTSALTTGPHSLSAVYSGDAAYNGSTGNDTHTVNKADTTLVISDPTDPTVFGQPVQVNATLAVTAPGAGTPTGTISVTATNSSGCTITLPATSCNLSFTTVGAQTINASYGGNTNFNGSTATAIGHTVNQAGTTLVISDPTDPTVFGQSVQVNAALSVTAPGAGTPTGTITVTATNSSGCTITLPATSCNLSFTAVGVQTVNASYGGDSSFSGSTASSIGHTVNKASTTVTISDPTDPTVFGQLVQVNGSVSATAPGAGTPGGTITVTATNSAGCTITLPATSCNLSFTAAGAQTINATYGGDASFNGSTASSIGHTVNKAGTTVTISDPTDPTVFGQAVQVNGSVSVTAPGAGTPGGTITVTATNSSGCTITLPATSCNLSFTAAGAQTINASYGGDANFASSTASAIAHQVDKAGTTLSIADQSDPSVVGQSVQVDATLSITAPGAGTPGGTIAVTATNSSGCTITLPATSCSLTFTAAGAQTIDASYGGDSGFNGSTAAQIGHAVGKASTTVTISDPTDPTVVGQPVQVDGSVAVTAPGAGTPGGTITVTATNSSGCTITLPATSCNLSFTTLGPQTIDASYGGDAKFNGSTAASIGHTVNKAATTVTIGDPVDPTVFGQLVQVNGTVAASAPGAGTPTGTITVTATNSPGCTITLPATSCTLAFATVGPQTINASYGGDGSFNGSTATAIGHTVNKAATTLVIDSDLPDPSAIGQAVTVQATLAVVGPGAGIPTGTVVVTAASSAGCTITLPANSCQLTFTAQGTKSIDASYAGDASFLGSVANSVQHSVNNDPDLAVTKDNGTASVLQGFATAYTIVVSNVGTIAVGGATVGDTPPAGLTDVAWTCTPTPPASCANASGSGALDEPVTLQPGESLTYVVTGTVSGVVGSTLTNTATITPPNNGNDADPSDNTASDADLIASTHLFEDGFEDPPPP